jgi:hypothetical protein
VQQRDFPSEVLTDNTKYGLDLTVRRPGNIKQFQQLWDSLLSWKLILWPEGFTECGTEVLDIDPPRTVVTRKDHVYGCKIQRDSSKQRLVPLKLALRKANALGDLLVLFGASRPKYNWDFEFAGLIQVSYGNHTENVEVVLPVEHFFKMEFNAQTDLAKRSEGWHNGPFSDVFRDLASVDGAFQEADLRSAERILADEEGRSRSARIKGPGRTGDSLGCIAGNCSAAIHMGPSA